MRSSRIGIVVVVALLGLALAATIAYAASQLVSQPIGLSSEPADVGESLAPVAASRPAQRETKTSTQREQTRKSGKSTTTPATESPPATTPATTPDDSGAEEPRSGDDGDHDADDD